MCHAPATWASRWYKVSAPLVLGRMETRSLQNVAGFLGGVGDCCTSLLKRFTLGHLCAPDVLE